MGSISANRAKLSWGFTLLAIPALLFASLLYVKRLVRADQAPPPTVRTLKLGTARPGTLYAMTVAVKDPAKLQGTDAILATVNDAQGAIDSKWLHTADLDFYLTLRPRAAGPITVTLSAPATVTVPEIAASLHKIVDVPALSGDITTGVIAAAPNGTWQTAQPFQFGQTIYGADDERPYAPSKSEDGYAAMIKGFQWFKFTFNEKTPRLVYFTLNVTDRDVPLRRRHLPASQGQIRRSPLQHRRIRLPGRSHPELSRPLQIPHPHP